MIPTQLQTLTYEQLLGSVVVLMILIGAYNTVMSAIKTHREETRRKEQPMSDIEKNVQEHEERLKRDHKRLNTIEEANRIQMRALMAILHHDIDGNSTDGLKKSYDEIQQYLIDK